MSFPQYESVKDTEFEWLGKVPSHWKLITLKHVAKTIMGQSPNSEECNLDGDGLPFLQGCGEFGGRSPIGKQYCRVPPKSALEGDILFSVRAPVGAINIADQPVGIGRGLCAIRAR